ncbi:MAG: hypothetical protein ACR2QV_05400, partial [Gammaproteobacteria bacterium]
MSGSVERSSIQQSAFPLAFRVDPGNVNLAPGASPGSVRVVARALEGMQKEAIAQSGADTWRVVCDEGPWLNGTDLAPFPLAFFCAGQAASYLAEFMAEAKERLIPITRLELRQDNFFTMEGSALKGTMSAGVDPVHVQFDADGDCSAAELRDIADVAINDRSPVAAVLARELPSRFAIRANGDDLAQGDALPVADADDPTTTMDACRPAGADSYAADVIRKVEETIEAGDAVGLKSSQKRVVHVATHARVRPDGILELAVQCIQPAGSRFVMLSDDSRARGGQGRAPDPLTYLSCGVAFCYMTQIGRYAQIVKQRLRDYRIVQETMFGFGPEEPPTAEPVATLVCVDSE